MYTTHSQRVVQSTNTKTRTTLLISPETTPEIPNCSSYDSYSASFDRGHNLNGYDQKTALTGQQRVGSESFSDTPGAPSRSVDGRQLSWWRGGVRKVLMNGLVHESKLLGAMQVRRIQSPAAKLSTWVLSIGEN